MHASHLLAFALSLATSEAATKGFNYGSTGPDGSYMTQEAFESAFETASNLIGASDFNSARLYTMIQGGTTNTPISAIPAAIATNTTLLLGLWASAGDADFDNEIEALKAAIKDNGAQLGNLVVGISVGSEDLYRNSVMGIKAKAGIGANPDTLVGYINKVKSTIAGTALSSARIGHVDTWTGWTNSSNNAVIDACDWIGVDAYPYFQSTMTNPVQDGKALIQSAISQTQAAVGSKEIWITETGWPVSGATQNQAVASVANAKTYWDDVGCGLLFDQTNTWWYILQDADATSTPSPSFGIVGTKLSTTPLFNLTCPAVTASSTANATTSASGSNSDSGSSTGTGSGSSGTKSSGSSSSSSPSSSTSAKSASGASTLTTSILASALVLVAAFAAL